MLQHTQTIDNSLVELYQEILTLQEELKDAHRLIREVARSAKPKEVARDYVAQLLKYPKT